MPKSERAERLSIEGQDLTYRVVSMAGEERRSGAIFHIDELRVTLYGHDPLPFPPHTSAPYDIRASWDRWRNTWEGKVRVVGWDIDDLGQHLRLSGDLQRIHDEGVPGRT